LSSQFDKLLVLILSNNTLKVKHICKDNENVIIH
jgi:hypothetical protein